MAIFSKSHLNTNSETTVISSGARIEGEFYFSSMLHLDGEISGIIHSNNIVVIGKTGVLKGQLNADKVVINGIFQGELETNSLEILAGGQVTGSVVVAHISIESGAKFNGTSKTKEESTIGLIENSHSASED